MKGKKNDSKWRHKKTQAELVRSFQNQVSNFKRSCKAFDDGHFEEAERLASSIYILCHDGRGRTKSLLGLLEIKKKIQMPDTASNRPQDDPNVVTAGPPLLAIWFGELPFEYRAPLGVGRSRMRTLRFSEWCEKEIYRNSQGKTLSRKNFVFYFRSQDGGAHVDDSLRDEAYYRFVRYGDHITTSADGTLSVGDAGDTSRAHLYTMRQIAWEVLQAIDEDESASSLLSQK